MGNRASEVRHRWLARAGIMLLLVVSLVPATGRIGEATAPLVERCREIFTQCALVLRSTGAPLQWLPLTLLVAGLVYAAVDRVRLTRRVRRMLSAHRVRRVTRGDLIGRLGQEFGVETDVRVLVGTAPNPAFTVGLLRPRIYVSEALQLALSPDELRAVFRHELYHHARRDPLRFAALRFAANTFFWLPVIRLLAADLMEHAELMADDFAASPRGGSDPLDVASALVKIGRVGRAHAPLTGVAGIGGFRLLDYRVRRLADEPALVASTVMVIPRRQILLSASALVLLWLASTFTPSAAAAASAAMTMRWGDRCPHSMQGMQGHCPECERRDEPMRGCPEARAS